MRTAVCTDQPSTNVAAVTGAVRVQGNLSPHEAVPASKIRLSEAETGLGICTRQGTPENGRQWFPLELGRDPEHLLAEVVQAGSKCLQVDGNLPSHGLGLPSLLWSMFLGCSLLDVPWHGAG